MASSIEQGAKRFILGCALTLGVILAIPAPALAETGDKSDQTETRTDDTKEQRAMTTAEALVALDVPPEAYRTGLTPDEILETVGIAQELGVDESFYQDPETWNTITEKIRNKQSLAGATDDVLRDAACASLGVPESACAGRDLADVLDDSSTLQQIPGVELGDAEAWKDLDDMTPAKFLCKHAGVCDDTGGSGSTSGGSSGETPDGGGSGAGTPGGNDWDGNNETPDDPGVDWDGNKTAPGTGSGSGSGSGSDGSGGGGGGSTGGTGTGGSTGSNGSGSGGDQTYLVTVDHDESGEGFTVTVTDSDGNQASAHYTPDGNGGYVDEDGNHLDERPDERTYKATNDDGDAIVSGSEEQSVSGAAEDDDEEEYCAADIDCGGISGDARAEDIRRQRNLTPYVNPGSELQSSSKTAEDVRRLRDQTPYVNPGPEPQNDKTAAGLDEILRQQNLDPYINPGEGWDQGLPGNLPLGGVDPSQYIGGGGSIESPFKELSGFEKFAGSSDDDLNSSDESSRDVRTPRQTASYGSAKGAPSSPATGMTPEQIPNKSKRAEQRMQDGSDPSVRADRLPMKRTLRVPVKERKPTTTSKGRHELKQSKPSRARTTLNRKSPRPSRHELKQSNPSRARTTLNRKSPRPSRRH